MGVHSLLYAVASTSAAFIASGADPDEYASDIDLMNDEGLPYCDELEDEPHGLFYYWRLVAAMIAIGLVALLFYTVDQLKHPNRGEDEDDRKRKASSAGGERSRQESVGEIKPAITKPFCEIRFGDDQEAQAEDGVPLLRNGDISTTDDFEDMQRASEHPIRRTRSQLSDQPRTSTNLNGPSFSAEQLTTKLQDQLQPTTLADAPGAKSADDTRGSSEAVSAASDSQSPLLPSVSQSTASDVSTTLPAQAIQPQLLAYADSAFCSLPSSSIDSASTSSQQPLEPVAATITTDNEETGKHEEKTSKQPSPLAKKMSELKEMGKQAAENLKAKVSSVGKSSRSPSPAAPRESEASKQQVPPTPANTPENELSEEERAIPASKIGKTLPTEARSQAAVTADNRQSETTKQPENQPEAAEHERQQQGFLESISAPVLQLLHQPEGGSEETIVLKPEISKETPIPDITGTPNDEAIIDDQTTKRATTPEQAPGLIADAIAAFIEFADEEGPEPSQSPDEPPTMAIEKKSILAEGISETSLATKLTQHKEQALEASVQLQVAASKDLEDAKQQIQDAASPPGKLAIGVVNVLDDKLTIFAGDARQLSQELTTNLLEPFIQLRSDEAREELEASAKTIQGQTAEEKLKAVQALQASLPVSPAEVKAKLEELAQQANEQLASAPESFAAQIPDGKMAEIYPDLKNLAATLSAKLDEGSDSAKQTIAELQTTAQAQIEQPVSGAIETVSEKISSATAEAAESAKEAKPAATEATAAEAEKSIKETAERFQAEAQAKLSDLEEAAAKLSRDVLEETKASLESEVVEPASEALASIQPAVEENIDKIKAEARQTAAASKKNAEKRIEQAMDQLPQIDVQPAQTLVQIPDQLTASLSSQPKLESEGVVPPEPKQVEVIDTKAPQLPAPQKQSATEKVGEKLGEMGKKAKEAIGKMHLPEIPKLQKKPKHADPLAPQSFSELSDNAADIEADLAEASALIAAGLSAAPELPSEAAEGETGASTDRLDDLKENMRRLSQNMAALNVQLESQVDDLVSDIGNWPAAAPEVVVKRKQSIELAKPAQVPISELAKQAKKKDEQKALHLEEVAGVTPMPEKAPSTTDQPSAVQEPLPESKEKPSPSLLETLGQTAKDVIQGVVSSAEPQEVKEPSQAEPTYETQDFRVVRTLEIEPGVLQPEATKSEKSGILESIAAKVGAAAGQTKAAILAAELPGFAKPADDSAQPQPEPIIAATAGPPEQVVKQVLVKQQTSEEKPYFGITALPTKATIEEMKQPKQHEFDEQQMDQTIATDASSETPCFDHPPGVVSALSAKAHEMGQKMAESIKAIQPKASEKPLTEVTPKEPEAIEPEPRGATIVAETAETVPESLTQQKASITEKLEEMGQQAKDALKGLQKPKLLRHQHEVSETSELSQAVPDSNQTEPGIATAAEPGGDLPKLEPGAVQEDAIAKLHEANAKLDAAVSQIGAEVRKLEDEFGTAVRQVLPQLPSAESDKESGRQDGQEKQRQPERMLKLSPQTDFYDLKGAPAAPSSGPEAQPKTSLTAKLSEVKQKAVDAIKGIHLPTPQGGEPATTSQQKPAATTALPESGAEPPKQKQSIGEKLSDMRQKASDAIQSMSLPGLQKKPHDDTAKSEEKEGVKEADAQLQTAALQVAQTESSRIIQTATNEALDAANAEPEHAVSEFGVEPVLQQPKSPRTLQLNSASGFHELDGEPLTTINAQEQPKPTIAEKLSDAGQQVAASIKDILPGHETSTNTGPDAAIAPLSKDGPLTEAAAVDPRSTSKAEAAAEAPKPKTSISDKLDDLSQKAKHVLENVHMPALFSKQPDQVDGQLEPTAVQGPPKSDADMLPVKTAAEILDAAQPEAQAVAEQSLDAANQQLEAAVSKIDEEVHKLEEELGYVTPQLADASDVSTQLVPSFEISKPSAIRTLNLAGQIGFHELTEEPKAVEVTQIPTTQNVLTSLEVPQTTSSSIEKSEPESALPCEEDKAAAEPNKKSSIVEKLSDVGQAAEDALKGMHLPKLGDKKEASPSGASAEAEESRAEWHARSEVPAESSLPESAAPPRKTILSSQEAELLREAFAEVMSRDVIDDVIAGEPLEEQGEITLEFAVGRRISVPRTPSPFEAFANEEPISADLHDLTPSPQAGLPLEEQGEIPLEFSVGKRLSVPRTPSPFETFTNSEPGSDLHDLTPSPLAAIAFNEADAVAITEASADLADEIISCAALEVSQLSELLDEVSRPLPEFTGEVPQAKLPPPAGKPPFADEAVPLVKPAPEAAKGESIPAEILAERPTVPEAEVVAAALQKPRASAEELEELSQLLEDVAESSAAGAPQPKQQLPEIAANQLRTLPVAYDDEEQTASDVEFMKRPQLYTAKPAQSEAELVAELASLGPEVEVGDIAPNIPAKGFTTKLPNEVSLIINELSDFDKKSSAHKAAPVAIPPAQPPIQTTAKAPLSPPLASVIEQLSHIGECTPATPFQQALPQPPLFSQPSVAHPVAVSSELSAAIARLSDIGKLRPPEPEETSVSDFETPTPSRGVSRLEVSETSGRPSPFSDSSEQRYSLTETIAGLTEMARRAALDRLRPPGFDEDRHRYSLTETILGLRQLAEASDSEASSIIFTRPNEPRFSLNETIGAIAAHRPDLLTVQDENGHRYSLTDTIAELRKFAADSGSEDAAKGSSQSQGLPSFARHASPAKLSAQQALADIIAELRDFGQEPVEEIDARSPFDGLTLRDELRIIPVQPYSPSQSSPTSPELSAAIAGLMDIGSPSGRSPPFLAQPEISSPAAPLLPLDKPLSLLLAEAIAELQGVGSAPVSPAQPHLDAAVPLIKSDQLSPIQQYFRAKSTEYTTPAMAKNDDTIAPEEEPEIATFIYRKPSLTSTPQAIAEAKIVRRDSAGKVTPLHISAGTVPQGSSQQPPEGTKLGFFTVTTEPLLGGALKPPSGESLSKQELLAVASMLAQEEQPGQSQVVKSTTSGQVANPHGSHIPFREDDSKDDMPAHISDLPEEKQQQQKRNIPSRYQKVVEEHFTEASEALATLASGLIEDIVSHQEVDPLPDEPLSDPKALAPGYIGSATSGDDDNDEEGSEEEDSGQDLKTEPPPDDLLEEDDGEFVPDEPEDPQQATVPGPHPATQKPLELKQARILEMPDLADDAAVSIPAASPAAKPPPVAAPPQIGQKRPAKPCILSTGRKQSKTGDGVGRRRKKSSESEAVSISEASTTATTRKSSLLEAAGVTSTRDALEKVHSLKELSEVMRKAGLESSNLIFGIDYTASNKYQGEHSYGGLSLHSVVPGRLNPYQSVISIIARTLAPFATSGFIPAFGFGDIRTADTSVFPLKPNGYCEDFDELMKVYNEITPDVVLSGPTNFAPIIYESIGICRQYHDYHILVIVADGQVTNERATRRAIVEACKYALSIIVVGVGDGPWDMMRVFDDSLPKRPWDNFHFLEFAEVMSAAQGATKQEVNFAVQTLLEIPDQYKKIKALGLLRKK